MQLYRFGEFGDLFHQFSGCREERRSAHALELREEKLKYGTE